MIRSPKSPKAMFLTTGLFVLAGIPAHAQQTGGPAGNEPDDPRLAILQAEDHVEPPSAILDAVMATTAEALRIGSIDATGTRFLRMVGDGFPTLERFAKRHYDLGQFQIDPAANRDRRLTTGRMPASRSTR